MNMFHHGPECSASRQMICTQGQKLTLAKHLVSNDCSILSSLPKNMVQLSSVSKVQRSGTLDNIVYPNVKQSGPQITFPNEGKTTHITHTDSNIDYLISSHSWRGRIWDLDPVTLSWPNCGWYLAYMWSMWCHNTLFVTITFPACSISAGLNWIWSCRWTICVIDSLQRALTKWYAVGWY